MNIEQARFNMIEQQIRPWDVLDPTVLDLLFVVKPSGIDHYRGIVAERNAMPEARRPGMGLDLVAESSILDGAMPGRQEQAP